MLSGLISGIIAFGAYERMKSKQFVSTSNSNENVCKEIFG